jgi:antirestriction protein
MAYEYDHDCPFEAFITNLGKYNEGELVGEWVKFPTTSEELQKVFERIGIGSKDDFGNPYEEWFISDYDCYVDGLYEKLGEYENLDELNYLASKLDELDDHDYNHFQAAMQISDYTGSIKDVINLIDNLDKYEIYPGVESNANLGHYYIEELGMMEVPDYLADYIDYEAYGRDVAINEMGQFTDYGYVRDTQESFTEYYDGDRENIPDEYRVMDFMVSGEKERKTMNYETFKQEFAEDIKEKLYERGYDDVRISFNNVEKTNQNYEAMSVVPEGNNVGVNFNIENAFASYEHTDDYAGVLASATMVIADGLDRAPAIDVSALMDYENMKEKLSVEVISADANADLLANVPHDRMEDLAVVYRFVMESSEDGRASILVTNNLMDRMGVSHEQLRSDALENSPEIRPVVIMGMNEVMKEMMEPEVYEMFGIPDDAEETMYVATVPDKNSGAGVIAYQDFMDQAAERVGGDFFVLPSSINEILLVPDNGDMPLNCNLKEVEHIKKYVDIPVICTGFVERKGNKKTKYLMPTHRGVALITVMPEQIQSPSMTAEWEQKLLDVEKGNFQDTEFMSEIEEMITDLVKTYKVIEDAEVLMHPAMEEIGICPCCGQHVIERQKGYSCENRGCNFVLWKQNRFFEALGKKMTKQTAIKLLTDGKVALKGCKSKKTGNTYDTTVVMTVDENQRAVFELNFEKGEAKYGKGKGKKN